MPQVEYTDYYSHILNMSIPVEVTGHYGYPMIMFPTSGGFYTQNSDQDLCSSVSYFTDSGKLKLFNLQTIDNLSFYADHLSPYERIYNYNQYMRFLAEEYVPYLQATHKTHRVAIAGASFGGYHAANFAFRYPDLISHMISLSGAYSIRNFMDGYSGDLVYFNCPEEFVPNDENWKYHHMKIVLSTSNWDICLDKNLKMSEILSQSGIDHWYDEAKWITHDWPLWRMVFPKFVGAFFG